MHERVLVADLVRRAAEIAAAEGATRVARMTVYVGALSHVDPLSLPHQVADEAAGTPAEGAVIDVVTGEGDPLADDRAEKVVLVSIEVQGDDRRHDPLSPGS